MSEFAITVDGKEVWRGRNLKSRFLAALAENPGKRVAIAWIPGPEIIVA